MRGPAVSAPTATWGRGRDSPRRAASWARVPDEGLAIAGIFGDASKLAEAVLRYPAAGS